MTVTLELARTYCSAAGGAVMISPEEVGLHRVGKGVSQPLGSAPTTPATPEVFAELVKQWKAERGPTSSAARMAKIPAYQKIIAIGKPAIPLLLDELKREPDHWFFALHAITGENPVPEKDNGKIADMAKAWLAWGKSRGHVR